MSNLLIEIPLLMAMLLAPVKAEALPKIEIQQYPAVEATYPVELAKAPSVEETIRQTAINFPEVDTLVKIAECESSFNPKSKNPHSSATGVFQILDMHGLSVEERQDPEIATQWAIEHFNNGHPWDSSRHCWGYKTSQHKVLKEIQSDLGKNCVTYAKSKKDLPQGLKTLKDKESHITTHKPAKGLVGVTNEGTAGHIIYVEQVNDDTLIISEGNYKHSFITWREIPKSMIIGYF
jgi:hypothetical protein